MNGVSRAAVVAATLTCIAATGCAKHEQTQTTTVVVQRSLANPSDFPLYPRSAVSHALNCAIEAVVCAMTSCPR